MVEFLCMRRSGSADIGPNNRRIQYSGLKDLFDVHELCAVPIDPIAAFAAVWAIAHFCRNRAVHAQHGMVKCRYAPHVAFDIMPDQRSPKAIRGCVGKTTMEDLAIEKDYIAW